MRARTRLICLLLPGLSLTSCGYTLQNSRNPLEKEEVRTIFIAPMANHSYKPGVEHMVYNALSKNLSAHGRVKVVQQEDEADAVLIGSVSSASSAVQTVTTVTIPQVTGDTKQVGVAVDYAASLACSFSLVRKRKVNGKSPGTLWGSSFGRSKFYPASNRVGTPGTTSALINDSEFDRALWDLAEAMMDDVHESMLSMF